MHMARSIPYKVTRQHDLPPSLVDYILNALLCPSVYPCLHSHGISIFVTFPTALLVVSTACQSDHLVTSQQPQDIALC